MVRIATDLDPGLRRDDTVDWCLRTGRAAASARDEVSGLAVELASAGEANGGEGFEQ